MFGKTKKDIISAKNGDVLTSQLMEVEMIS
jgi:hypothetical protein